MACAAISVAGQWFRPWGQPQPVQAILAPRTTVWMYDPRMAELSGWITPALVCALFLYLVRRLDTLAQGMGELRERMAKLEGALDGFIAGRREHQ